jgi:amino acid transporter
LTTREIEEKLFARKASGLVKEASPAKAGMFNIANIMGSKFAWSVAYLGLFPAALISGAPAYIWGVLLFTLASFILGTLYIQLTTPMPRSGADYVIPARLMGPFWGWINSWMIVWSWIPVWAWMAWVTVRNVKLLIDILRVVHVTEMASGWVYESPAIWIIGIGVIIIAMLMCMVPPRRYYSWIAGLAVFSIVGLVLVVYGAFAATANFSANMNTLFGTSVEGLIDAAKSQGWDPNEMLGWTTGTGMMGYILFIIGGYQYSASISGELRGDVKRGLMISIFGSLIFFLIFTIPFVMLVLNQFGYQLVTSWSWLFWNARDLAPLALPPINALLCAVGLPDLWALWLIAGLAGIVGTWLCIPASMMYCNRLAFAWGMDRLMPKSITDVHPKYHQPMRLFAVEAVLGIIFYAAQILFDFNPVSFAWWSILLMLPSYFFPAICALLIRKRRPDLFKNVPWSRWLVPLGILWIAIMVPFYGLGGIVGSVPPISPGINMWEWAISTGLIVTAAFIVAGLIIYFVVRWWNIKRGIKFDEIYKLIPPE